LWCLLASPFHEVSLCDAWVMAGAALGSWLSRAGGVAQPGAWACWECRHREQLEDPTGVEDMAEEVYFKKYGMVPGGVSVLAVSFTSSPPR